MSPVSVQSPSHETDSLTHQQFPPPQQSQSQSPRQHKRTDSNRSVTASSTYNKPLPILSPFRGGVKKETVHTIAEETEEPVEQDNPWAEDEEEDVRDENRQRLDTDSTALMSSSVSNAKHRR